MQWPPQYLMTLDILICNMQELNVRPPDQMSAKYYNQAVLYDNNVSHQMMVIQYIVQLLN